MQLSIKVVQFLWIKMLGGGVDLNWLGRLWWNMMWIIITFNIRSRMAKKDCLGHNPSFVLVHFFLLFIFELMCIRDYLEFKDLISTYWLFYFPHFLHVGSGRVFWEDYHWSHGISATCAGNYWNFLVWSICFDFK